VSGNTGRYLCFVNFEKTITLGKVLFKVTEKSNAGVIEGKLELQQAYFVIQDAISILSSKVHQIIELCNKFHYQRS
jgi:hypothetical protein